ncbi:sugar transferase [Candidatus Nitrospira bockiana]
MKRLLDMLLAGTGLVALLPVLLVVALGVRVMLGRPVLFRQRRPGLGMKPFVLYKFRTMTNQRGPNGSLLPDPERLTAFGRFLRATSLDELPELINVVKGEMSLVGPRPLLMEYIDRYTPEQRRRHDVPPGITGWAQIHGRNQLTWEQKFELDLWYVAHRSVWLDLKILALTAAPLLMGTGISHPGHATMARFKGTTDNSEALR